MLRQIPWQEAAQADWVPQAVIGRPVSYFEDQLGIQFSRNLDDLDYYEGAALLLPEHGRREALPFVLMHYRGHPADTVTVYLPPKVDDLNDISAVTANIADQLGLSQSDFTWTRDLDPDL